MKWSRFGREWKTHYAQTAAVAMASWIQSKDSTTLSSTKIMADFGDLKSAFSFAQIWTDTDVHELKTKRTFSWTIQNEKLKP